MFDKILHTVLSFVLGRTVANSERLRAMLAAGVVSVLALVGLPEAVAQPAAQAVAAAGVYLATLYTIRKPGAPTITLPPPPASADGVPGA